MTRDSLHGLVFWLILVPLASVESLSQTDTAIAVTGTSDKGTWVGLRGGSIFLTDEAFTEFWYLGFGVDFRFARHVSVPVEVEILESFLLGSAALKVRIPFDRRATNIHAQGGIEAGLTALGFYAFHVAVGAEYGILDRLAVNLQVKKYPEFPEPTFFSIGISVDATSSALREEYDNEE